MQYTCLFVGWKANESFAYDSMLVESELISNQSSKLNFWRSSDSEEL